MHLDICITVAQTFRLGEYAYFYYHHPFIQIDEQNLFYSYDNRYFFTIFVPKNYK